jgi:hypothetical protein
MSWRMAWRTAGTVGRGGGPLILFSPPCCFKPAILLWRSSLKAAFQYLQPVACSVLRCPDTEPSIFRSSRTGA